MLADTAINASHNFRIFPGGGGARAHSWITNRKFPKLVEIVEKIECVEETNEGKDRDRNRNTSC